MWALLLMLYFNVLTIVVEFIAYYVYIAVEQEFSTLYQQLYKLALDLMPFWEYVFIIASGLLVYRALARKVEDLEIRGDL